jgi:hypothetical protein
MPSLTHHQHPGLSPQHFCSIIVPTGFIERSTEVRMSARGRSMSAALVALFGWGGLAYLVTRASPRPYTWLFFLALLLVTLTFTAFLPLQYLHLRLSRSTPGRALRQSFWLALFVVLCAWLQMRRVLDWAVALLLAAVFGLIESYLLSRE